MQLNRSIFLIFLFVACALSIKAQQRIDTTRVYNLNEVVVKENRKMKELRSTTPLQVLDGSKLRQSGAMQVSDAAKMFSGVVIKDYGGIGGLKTISIRGLNAAHTAIAYDGITISNAQTGQIDLGKLSLDNVDVISLNSGQSDNIFQPARLFSAAGILNIHTLTPVFNNKSINTKLSLKAGSFGLVNPAIRIENRLSSIFSTSVSFDYLHVKGGYPYIMKNGEATGKRHRENSDVESFKAEANMYGKFSDQEKANLKVYYYQSERGLPNNILYNTYAADRLWDKNFFAQTSYENKFNSKLSLLTNAKFNWTYSRYYGAGTTITNNHYYQNEYYLSATVMYRPTDNLSFSLANDGIINKMRADLSDFVVPTRYTLQTVLAARYVRERFTGSAHLLSTLTKETVKYGSAADNRQRLSPSVSLSFQPFKKDNLRIRLFYKDIFRLPTFNDLYYGTVGTRTLKPEKASEFSAGFTWLKATGSFLKHFSLSTDAFYNRVTDKIIAYPTKNTFLWSMRNIGRVDIKGTEVNAETSFALHKDVSLNVTGSYTWQRALDKTSKHDTSDKYTYNHQIPYTPRHSGSIRLGLEMPWVNINYTLMISGERYALPINSSENYMGGYQDHTLTFYRTLKLKKCSLNAQFEILNLTNRQYDIVANYPMPGRQFRGSLTFNY